MVDDSESELSSSLSEVSDSEKATTETTESSDSEDELNLWASDLGRKL